MTTGQRSFMSFLDLALLMTGVMAMLVHVGDRQQATAAAIADHFSDEAHARKSYSYPIASFFEPQDARLSDQGKAKLDGFARLPKDSTVLISVPVTGHEAEGRLSHWEIAAARTASIMHYLAAKGLDESRLTPKMQPMHQANSDGTQDSVISIVTISGHK